MNQAKLPANIKIDPHVFGGRPFLKKGDRLVDVLSVIEELRRMSIENVEIVWSIDREDIQSCLDYAACKKIDVTPHIKKLSLTLKPVLQHELSRANEVTCAAMWGENLVVTLKNPLDMLSIEKLFNVNQQFTIWESRDPHYAIEKGIRCNSSGQSMAGPIR